MTREILEIIIFVISAQWRAFSTVFHDLSAAMTDSFEGMGTYLFDGWGAYWRIYGIIVLQKGSN